MPVLPGGKPGSAKANRIRPNKSGRTSFEHWDEEPCQCGRPRRPLSKTEALLELIRIRASGHLPRLHVAGCIPATNKVVGLAAQARAADRESNPPKAKVSLRRIRLTVRIQRGWAQRSSCNGRDWNGHRVRALDGEFHLRRARFRYCRRCEGRFCSLVGARTEACALTGKCFACLPATAAVSGWRYLALGHDRFRVTTRWRVFWRSNGTPTNVW